MRREADPHAADVPVAAELRRETAVAPTLDAYDARPRQDGVCDPEVPQSMQRGAWAWKQVPVVRRGRARERAARDEKGGRSSEQRSHSRTERARGVAASATHRSRKKKTPARRPMTVPVAITPRSELCARELSMASRERPPLRPTRPEHFRLPALLPLVRNANGNRFLAEASHTHGLAHLYCLVSPLRKAAARTWHVAWPSLAVLFVRRHEDLTAAHRDARGLNST